MRQPAKRVSQAGCITTTRLLYCLGLQLDNYLFFLLENIGLTIMMVSGNHQSVVCRYWYFKFLIEAIVQGI